MRTLKKNSPGRARSYVLSNASADYCDVTITDEHITLRFERQPDGVIRCTARQKEMTDVPDHASRDGFLQARLFARKQMNILRDKEARRAALEEPVIELSTRRECTLSYAGNQYSYTCEVNLPLTWENLKLAAVLYGAGNRTFLSPEEGKKLKARAFSRIQERRRGDYADDGKGEFIETSQLKLAL